MDPEHGDKAEPWPVPSVRSQSIAPRATIEEFAVGREVCAVRLAPLEWIRRAGNNRLSILHRARLRL